MHALRLAALAAIVMLAGCATAIPTSPRMSDAMLMNIKQAPVKVVAYEYQSKVLDGEIRPAAKNSREADPTGPLYVHTQSATLNKMLTDYVAMKFAAVDPAAPAKLRVTLDDFWIEQFNMESTGKQIAVAFFGGEMSIGIVAHLSLTFELFDGPVPVTKKVTLSSDSTHVAGVGTFSSTSSYYRGRDSIEFRVAEAINGANNKAVALLNQFIDQTRATGG